MLSSSLIPLVFAASVPIHAAAIPFERFKLLGLLDRRTNDKADKFSASVPLRSYGGTTYTLEVKLGNPPQCLELALDTGTTDTWVYVEGATTDSPVFESSRSDSFTDKNVLAQCRAKNTVKRNNTGSVCPFTGTGSATFEGVWASDFLDVAGERDKQAFGAVTCAKDLPYVGNFSGALGMGLAGGSAEGVTPFWQAHVADWVEPVFGIYLPRHDDSVKDFDKHVRQVGATQYPQGVIHYGSSYQNTPYSGLLRRTVSEPNSWRVPIAGVFPVLNTPKRTNDVDKNCTTTPATVSSGAGTIAGPPTAVADFYAHVPGAVYDDATQTYLYPRDECLGAEVHVGDDIWPVSKLDVCAEVLCAKDVPITPRRRNNDKEDKWCRGAVVPNNKDEWVLGTPFLHNVFTVFKYRPLGLGFAPLNDYYAWLNNATENGST